jgi:hypothetical protein
VVLHHVIAGEILSHGAGRLDVRALSGARAEIRWDPALGAGVLERRPVEDPLLTASWDAEVHRLRLAVAGTTATVRVRAARGER